MTTSKFSNIYFIVQSLIFFRFIKGPQKQVSEPEFANVEGAQKSISFRLCSLAGRYDNPIWNPVIDYLESIPGFLKRLQIRALLTQVC